MKRSKKSCLTESGYKDRLEQMYSTVYSITWESMGKLNYTQIQKKNGLK